MTPYIGITDFTHFDQVKKMLWIFDSHKKPGSKRRLHVGVMMSFKTLHGMPTKWADAFPANGRIQEIFASHDSYNCLHYADYDNNPKLRESLAQAIYWGGRGIHAVQLDMIWPEPNEIRQGRWALRQPVEVILQIGSKAMEAAGNTPKGVVARLREYEDVIHRVLLDKSAGKGLGMDALALLPYAEAIREHCPKLGIGAAGGLGPETMSLVEPLAKVIPDLSIDAQGRLRPSGNALQPIDWNLARTYLIEALKIFN